MKKRMAKRMLAALGIMGGIFIALALVVGFFTYKDAEEIVYPKEGFTLLFPETSKVELDDGAVAYMIGKDECPQYVNSKNCLTASFKKNEEGSFVLMGEPRRIVTFTYILEGGELGDSKVEFVTLELDKKGLSIKREDGSLVKPLGNMELSQKR